MTPKALKGKAVGPFDLQWENSAFDTETALLTHLQLPDDDDALVDLSADVLGGDLLGLPLLKSRIERRRQLTQTSSVLVRDIRRFAKRACQAVRAHSSDSDKSKAIKAMTIHQAKNREFPGVVLFWPYEVQGDLIKQRRLLYNAITRAKHWVTVLVQSLSSQGRSHLPPFNLPEN